LSQSTSLDDFSSLADFLNMILLGFSYLPYSSFIHSMQRSHSLPMAAALTMCCQFPRLSFQLPSLS
jgi:hypothetical protein